MIGAGSRQEQQLDVLDIAAVWERVTVRNERVILELERLVASSFDRALDETEREHGARLTALLLESFRTLRLSIAVDLVLQLRDGLASAEDGPSRGPELGALLEDLRTLLVVTGADAVPPPPDAPLLLALGDRSMFTDAVLWTASTSGLRVAQEDSCIPVPGGRVDIVFISAQEAAPEALRLKVRAAAATYGCPVVAHTDRDDLETRAAIARDVASLIVERPPADVVAEIQAILRRRLMVPALAVHARDPEPLVRALLAQGLKVEAIHEAADLIRLARTGGIHGVIVGDDFGRQERIGVPALVRSEPDARHVAVISLLCDDDAGHVLELLRAGADEVLPAHAAPDVLAALCRHRVRRILDLAADRARDDRVGSLSQRHARLVIERMLLSAYQRRSSVSIGLISFDSAAMNDERSSAIADALAREFRRGDIVGRWSGRQFIVALQGVGRRTTARRLEDALRNLAVGNDSRAAVVEYPHDGQTLDDLVAAANALEQAARFDDGPRVVTADWRASGEMSADVLVVDPDATIRALMSSLFERNKLSVIQLNNGVAALEYLTSALDGALPRVMVMELDLMGIDGLQLLRRLRDGGVLGRMRVLVVTARIREGELVEALNLGASDVVTKPFSPALLVHRLRRVMEA